MYYDGGEFVFLYVYQFSYKTYLDKILSIYGLLFIEINQRKE